MNLNFVSAFVPPTVAKFLTPERMALCWRAATEAVQYVQAHHAGASSEIQKKKALEFAVASYDLAMNVLVSDEITAYVRGALLPGMIDGAVMAFKLAAWFPTSKPLQIGGAHNPSPPPALSQIPSAAPPVTPQPKPPGAR